MFSLVKKYKTKLPTTLSHPQKMEVI